MTSYRRWRWVCTHASLYSSSPLHRSPIAHAVSTLFGCQVRDVIKKHRVGLQRVFAYYCTQCTELGGASDSMNCDAFLLMLKHAHLLDRHLTPLVVKHVFALTQLVRQRQMRQQCTTATFTGPGVCTGGDVRRRCWRWW